MAVKLEAVRGMVERAAHAVDTKAPNADVLCNMAKVFASEEVMKVAMHCVEPARRQRHDAGVRRREALPRRRDLLHMDATVDISKFKIVKGLYPATAGKYAGPEA